MQSSQTFALAASYKPGLCIDPIAARAGVCRRLAQNAIRLAEGDGLLTIEERRHEGQKNSPNLVRVISREWQAWMRRSGNQNVRTTGMRFRRWHARRSHIVRVRTLEGGLRSHDVTGAPTLDAYSRDEWETYFDAVAVELIAKPHTARRRARDMAKLCPYADVAAAGLARVRAAVKVHVDITGPKDCAKWH
jgi:hypothetical protein